MNNNRDMVENNEDSDKEKKHMLFGVIITALLWIPIGLALILRVSNVDGITIFFTSGAVALVIVVLIYKLLQPGFSRLGKTPDAEKKA